MHEGERLQSRECLVRKQTFKWLKENLQNKNKEVKQALHMAQKHWDQRNKYKIWCRMAKKLELKYGNLQGCAR